jgi:hypothetical protein
MKWDYDHHVVPPITSSATYRLDSAERGAQGFIEFAHTTDETKRKQPILIYDRLGEPNKDMLEENLAFAESGDCAVTFGCGMAAISAIFGILTKSGDDIIAHRTMYGCTYSLLTNWYPRYNINVQLLNLHDHRRAGQRDQARRRGSSTSSRRSIPRSRSLTSAPSPTSCGRSIHDASRGRTYPHRGRQHLRNSVLPATDRTRRGLRHPLPHQRASVASAPTWAAW